MRKKIFYFNMLRRPSGWIYSWFMDIMINNMTFRELQLACIITSLSFNLLMTLPINLVSSAIDSRWLLLVAAASDCTGFYKNMNHAGSNSMYYISRPTFLCYCFYKYCILKCNHTNQNPPWWWMKDVNGYGLYNTLFCDWLIQGWVGGSGECDWPDGRALWGDAPLHFLFVGRWCHCGSGLSGVHRLWIRWVHHVLQMHHWHISL